MIKTGAEYLESIRDGRVIYVGREQIPDQTIHPAFAGCARTYAALYDMKADPANAEIMTFEENGERYPMYFLRPRNQEDLVRRNRAHRMITDFTFGLMGRTPDAVAGNISGPRHETRRFRQRNRADTARIFSPFMNISAATIFSRPMPWCRRPRRATTNIINPPASKHRRCASPPKTAKVSR